MRLIRSIKAVEPGWFVPGAILVLFPILFFEFNGPVGEPSRVSGHVSGCFSSQTRGHAGPTISCTVELADGHVKSLSPIKMHDAGDPVVFLRYRRVLFGMYYEFVGFGHDCCDSAGPYSAPWPPPGFSTENGFAGKAPMRP